MLVTLRWLVAAVIPTALFGALAWRFRRRSTPRENVLQLQAQGGRQPLWLLVTTFVLGALAAVASWFVERRVSAWTGFDLQASVAGEASALVFVFLVLEPLRESAKWAATWPAFLSHHFDDPRDGVLYATASALGFASVGGAVYVATHPGGALPLWRVLVALPAGVFFACVWGYALGRSKQSRRSTRFFPPAFAVALVGHALYDHLVYGRGSAAMLGVLPMLAVMGLVAWGTSRDLTQRRQRTSLGSVPPSGGGRLSRVSGIPSSFPGPPSLSAMRDALRRANEPIKVRWIFFGALVTIGAMVFGVTATVILAHFVGIDFSTVDEHDVAASAPVLFLGAGLLAAFPLSGWLVARAADVRTLLEPALATAVALGVTLVAVGFATPIGVVFGLALSPIAWALACFGAWLGTDRDAGPYAP